MRRAAAVVSAFAAACAACSIISVAGYVATLTQSADDCSPMRSPCWRRPSRRSTFDPASTTLLTTRQSADFITWQDGTSIALPHPNDVDGRELAVAELPSSSRSFHLAISLLESRMDLRS